MESKRVPNLSIALREFVAGCLLGGSLFGLMPTFGRRTLCFTFCICMSGLSLLSDVVSVIEAVVPQVVQSAVADDSIETPDEKYLFIEDQIKEKKKKLKIQEKKIDEKRARLIAERKKDLPFDIDAKSLHYDSQNRKVKAGGGIVIGYPTGIVEAEEAEIDIESADAEIRGNVRISDIVADITTDKAVFNLKSGLGRLENTHIDVVEGGYRIDSEYAEKISDDTFEFRDGSVTTCNCSDDPDCKPWSFSADSGRVRVNGYGQIWNGFFRAYDVPVVYLPYMHFPVKTERQSGFLSPTIGSSTRGGFKLYAPYYWAMDDSADMTLTTIVESKMRAGVDVEMRSIFSKDHFFEGGAVYLDESTRDGKLMGTNTEDVFDPTLDTERYAGFLNYNNNFKLGRQPFQMIGDGHYASDDLFVREFDNEKIGRSTSRYLISELSLRTLVAQSYIADVSTEYNQSITADQDFTFQRVPAVTLGGFKSFRTFGENDYGLKLVSTSKLSYIDFMRDESYDGSRSEAYQALKIPYYIGNYVDGFVSGDIRGSLYNMDETNIVRRTTTTDPLTGENINSDEVTGTISSSSDRAVPGVSTYLSSTFEKIMEVEEGNPIKYLADLGPSARTEGLQKLKHSIQPVVRYRYVPEVDQSDNPQFDSLDLLAQKNVVTMQLVQRLFGRYQLRDEYLYGIEESAPAIGDVGYLRNTGPLDPGLSFGLADSANMDTDLRARRGSIVELANLAISQSYDVNEARNDEDEELEPWSDIGVSTTFLPNSHFRLGAGMDYDRVDSSITDYNVRMQLVSKRGDQLLTRLTFLEDQVRQLESGVQLNVFDGLKVGYYSRYDDLSGQFIDNRLGARFYGSCRCWIFDVDVHDKINPEETQVNFKLTLLGIGDIKNPLFSDNKNTLALP